MQDIREKWWKWFEARAHGTQAKAWLALLSFTESSFFLIPPDLFLIAILMAGSERWVYYAALTTIASVLGGIFGYFLGYFFYDTIGSTVIDFYNLSAHVEKASNLFDDNTFLVMFTAAFTPIPYKVFVLLGGFFKVTIVQFLLASILGRGMRFFIVAFLMHRFGEGFTRVALKHLDIFTLLFALAITLFFLSQFNIALF